MPFCYLQTDGYVTLCSVGAVIRHNLKNVAYCRKFVLKNYKVFVSEADYGVNLTSELVELLCDGICDSTTNATANYCYLFKSFCVRGNSKGANEIVNVFTFVKKVELFCC